MKRIVNFGDPQDVKDWLEALGQAVEAVLDTGWEASRPKRKRVLSRAQLQRQLYEGDQALTALLLAGKLGIGPKLTVVNGAEGEPRL